MSSMSEDSNGVRRRKANNTYTRQDLKNAINLIVERGTSIRGAAYMCNVPRTTLSTYLKSITHGKISKLHPPEEQALYQWMTDCCKRGFSVRKRNVETAAEALVQKSVPARTHPFQDTVFGKRCYQKFVKKWLSIDRVKDRKHLGGIADWFLHIETYLVEANLFEILSNPNRIFLCDELRFRERVEMRESVRAVLKKMTMLYTFSAAGEHLSPLLVYPYRRDVPPDIVKAAPKNCAIVAHEYGMVTPKTFAAYLDKVVDKFVTASNVPKPVIMFVDESQVDLTLHLHNTCKRLGIVLLALTPTHVVKPTANVFNDICAGWEKELPQLEKEAGRPFTLADCAGLMQTVNQRYIKSEVLKQDFSASFLHPWKRPIRPEASGVGGGVGGGVPCSSKDPDSTMDPDDDDDDDDDDEEEEERDGDDDDGDGDDDDEENDNEIENFLENVDGWSDMDDADIDEVMEDEGDDDDDDVYDDDGMFEEEEDEEEVEQCEQEEQVNVEPTLEKQKATAVVQADSAGEKNDLPEKAAISTNGHEQKATDAPKSGVVVVDRPEAKESSNGATGEEESPTKEEADQTSPNAPPSTDDENEGPPDDIDISINFIDFKRAIGKELTEKFEHKLETQDRVALTNHAENVLYDIYRQFRCDVVTDSDDDYDIVEVGDD